MPNPKPKPTATDAPTSQEDLEHQLGGGLHVGGPQRRSEEDDIEGAESESESEMEGRGQGSRMVDSLNHQGERDDGGGQECEGEREGASEYEYKEQGNHLMDRMNHDHGRRDDGGKGCPGAVFESLNGHMAEGMHVTDDEVK